MLNRCTMRRLQSQILRILQAFIEQKQIERFERVKVY